MRWRAPPGGKAHLEQREVGRTIEHLPRVAADAGDVAQRLVDLGDISLQLLELSSCSGHRLGPIGRGREPCYKLMRFYRASAPLLRARRVAGPAGPRARV